MTHISGTEQARTVRSMFARIASHYDLMNRLMTAGQDRAWRRQVVRLARLLPDERLLDIGAGTGDLAREAIRQQPAARVVAADFTVEMMHRGQQGSPLDWCAADALQLPFPDQAFDAVVSGFLVRNVTDLPQTLREQHRVLRPGGRLVILDTTRPRRSLLSPLIWFHMHVVIPVLGALISGASDAYHYLPDSTEKFLSAQELAGAISSVGFEKVQFKVLMFGTVAIHSAERMS